MEEQCTGHGFVLEKLMEHEKLLGFADAKIKVLCEQQEEIFGRLNRLADDGAKAFAHLNTVLVQVEKSLKVSEGNPNTKVEEERLPGLAGFLNRGWVHFLDKIDWIVIMVGSWALVKILFFGEYPKGILNFLTWFK